MPKKSPYTILLTESEKSKLEAMARKYTLAYYMVVRAKIVLLAAHNHGQSSHTAKFKPWQLIMYLAFRDRSKAISFEKYLKSHSGKAFANK